MKSGDSIDSSYSSGEPSPSLSSSSSTDTKPTGLHGDQVTFRYTWPLKISKRLVGCGDKAILNVSPPFCTAFNGVQFTWVLRMCDEKVLEIADIENFDENRPSSSHEPQVNVTLYYKDGPAQDVTLEGASISVNDSQGRRIFADMPLEGQEYTKGSGWSPFSCDSTERHLAFSNFIHKNVGRTITVSVDLRINVSWFQPLKYLPNIDGPGKQLETICERVLKEICSSKLAVPDAEFFDNKNDKFALHRHVFLFASDQIADQCEQDPSLNGMIDLKKIQNVFAHIYFNQVIMADTKCFEDFVDILEASLAVQFPALKRECERFICREVMLETSDLSFVKKMLLLAERYDLPVLKMVSFGVLADRLISADQPEEQMEGIREELMQIAEQIATTDDDDEGSADECDSELLVCSVVDQLEELARHIRKVVSPGSPSCTSPAPLPPPELGGYNLNARRSSLKTSRELLFLAQSSLLPQDGINKSATWGASSSTSTGTSSTGTSATGLSEGSTSLRPRRRSVMFSLPSETCLKFSEEDEYLDSPTKSSSTSLEVSEPAEALKDSINRCLTTIEERCPCVQ